MPDGPRRIFTKYLNESQQFRILLGTSVVYTQGRFFTPNLRRWRGGGSRMNIERIVGMCRPSRHNLREGRSYRLDYSHNGSVGSMRSPYLMLRILMILVPTSESHPSRTAQYRRRAKRSNRVRKILLLASVMPTSGISRFSSRGWDIPSRENSSHQSAEFLLVFG
jgi:hypothetical protein